MSHPREVTFRLKTTTALFLHGAEHGRAELRPTTFKGLSRYWFRALVGPALHSTDPECRRLRELEAAVFGSTGCRGVAFAVPPAQGCRGERFLLPHKLGNQRSRSACLEPGCDFAVQLRAYGPGRGGELVAAAWSFWLATTLGGFGQRSRRGAGSVTLVQIESEDGVTLPTTPDLEGAELAHWLGDELRRCREEIARAVSLPVLSTGSSEPSYPQLSAESCRICVAPLPEATGNEEQARKQIMLGLRNFKSAAFGLPYLQPARGEQKVGGRHASPLWVHLHRGPSGLGAIYTLMWSQKARERSGCDRQQLDAFLRCQRSCDPVAL